MANQTKSYRKFVASAATATLVASALVPVASAAPADTASTFTDVAPQYQDAVNYLVNNDITNGKSPTQFGTAENILRADAAVWIAKAVLTGEQLENAKDSGFTDVPARAKNYVDALKENNVLNGINATQFGSNRNIKRGDVARILTEAYQIEGSEGNVTFTDVAPQYKAAVAALLDNDITSGKKGNRFGTDDNITRGELAIWIQKLELLDRDVEPGELRVQSATAISKTLVEVKFNDGKSETYTVKELEVGKATDVEVEYKGEKFTVNVTWKGETQAAPGTVAFSNQPSAKALPFSSQLNEVYKFQITAGEDAINLRSVQLKQYGTASASEDDIKNVHLAVNGDIQATGTINANGEVRLTRSINIPANSTVELTVLADINKDATPTATVQFGIESINAFTANATLNGSFPNLGNSFNVVAGNIGTVTVTGTSGKLSDVETGDVQEELGKFTLQAGSQEGVKVNRITLEANGFNADDFDNLYLYQNNGSDKIDVQGVASRNEVVFELSDKDLEIGRNQSKSFVLKGDPASSTSSAVTGSFELAESYHLVTQGLNTGYNNGNTVDNGKSLGSLTVKLGEPKFRISTNSPKTGDKIVASISDYGVVREYTLNPASQEVTLKNGQLTVQWEDKDVTDLSRAVRAIELYDANTGSVIKTFDIDNPDSGSSKDSKFTFKASGINWYADKSMDLQIRAVATSDDVKVEKFDAYIDYLNYDIQLPNGKKESGEMTGPAASAQWKEFTTTGDTEVQRPGSSSRIAGYSISAGLSDALLGNFRIEAKEEAVKVTEADVVIDGLDKINIDSAFANPRLTHDGKIVAYGDIKNGKIEFDFVDNFTVEKGTSARKVLELRADVLENSDLSAKKLMPKLDRLETRGVNSNIVSDANIPTANENLLTSDLDYRQTTIEVNVSQEAVDTVATTSTRVLKFKVTNLSPNNPGDNSKVAKIEQFGFENLFNFPAVDNKNIFELRDDKAKSYGFKGSIGGDNQTILLKGDGGTNGTPGTTGDKATFTDNTTGLTVTAVDSGEKYNGYQVNVEAADSEEEQSIVVNHGDKEITISVYFTEDSDGKTEAVTSFEGIDVVNEDKDPDKTFTFDFAKNAAGLTEPVDLESTDKGTDDTSGTPGTANVFNLKGDDDEVFFLYGDFSEKLNNDSDYSHFRNVRMRIDAKADQWVIKDSNDDEITPLLINQGEGPDIVITD